MARYENRRIAASKGYDLAMQWLEHGGAITQLVTVARAIAKEYRKDLDEAIELIEKGPETKDAATDDARPSTSRAITGPLAHS